MNVITHRDSYFRCIETQKMPYGEVETGWMIGQARDDRDKIEYHWTPPMDVTEIAYHNLPKSEQYFRRESPPKCWDQKVLREVAKLRFSKGTTDKQREDPNFTNFNWWRVYENMTEEMRDYFDQEWERRNNGFVFFNNGEVTYMTGAHYTYCTHWWLKIGQYPNYKDRNKMDFYAWKSIEEDPSALGLLTPKHRRSNHTSIACFLGWEYVSRTPGTHFAIQSHGEKGAEANFRDKVVPGWKKLVPFFQPIAANSDNPQESIIMENIGRTGSKKGLIHDGEEAINSKILYAPNGNGVKEPLDGEALHRYVRDEPFKEDALDILLQWGVMRRTMGKRGKAFFCSTRESVKAPYTEKAKQLFDQSLMSIALDAGGYKTQSGLRALFIPCFVGHSIEGMLEMFTDKFGNSVIHQPDPETKAWLLENRCEPEERKLWSKIYDKGGAYEYELQQRITNKQDPAEKRRMPFNIDEVFAIVNPSSDFDMPRMNRTLAKLDEQHGTTTLENALTMMGRLEYVGGEEKGNVIFVPDPKGAFNWNVPYLPVPRNDNDHDPYAKLRDPDLPRRLRLYANNIERDPPRQMFNESHGCVRPKVDKSKYTDYADLSHIVIGMDPTKLSAIDQKAKRRSKSSSHGFYPYREMVDGPWTVETESDPDFAEDWESCAYIFEYNKLTAEPKVHHSDMLKAAIFLNAKILFESQIPTFREFMRDKGAFSFLLTDRPWSKSKDKVVAGLASSPQVIDMYFAGLASWITRFCYPNKMPFRTTIQQWMMMDGGDMERYDAGVSSGYAQIAAYPHGFVMNKKSTNLEAETVAVFDMSDCYPESRRNNGYKR